MVDKSSNLKTLYWRMAIVSSVVVLAVILTFNNHVSSRELENRVVFTSNKRVSSRQLEPQPGPTGFHNVSLLREELEKEHAKQREHCGCPGVKSSLNRTARERLPEQSLKVREHAYNRWKRRQKVLNTKPPLALCPAESPLQFLASGIEIEPMESVTLVGLAASSAAIKSLSSRKDGVMYTLVFTSRCELGTLSLSCDVDVRVEGNRTKQMTLSIDSRHASSLQAALKCVVYQSTVVYVIDEWETVEVSFGVSILNIHIRIRRQPLPFLYKTSSVSPPIQERVTIITKSFERYKELNRLIDSATRVYPNVTVLVADDSVHFQQIDKPNALQYRMPAQAGWFAGRNLLVSQVLTEYLVWVDDDCVFTEHSKLEFLMEMLDKLELRLDLVAGRLAKNGPRCGTCVDIGRDKEEYCLRYRERCTHGSVEGYPHCVYSDRTPNFFMARTRSVQHIGFDPHYDHIGHIEFFSDGYHFLKSACCNDIYVDHLRGGSEFYKKNRFINETLMKEHIKYNLFKYNAKQECFYK